MNFPISPRFSPRDTFARFFVAWVLFSSASLFAARAQDAQNGPITNASPSELQEITATVNGLERAARARDANALAFFGASVPADDAPLKLTDRVTHVAVSPGGALVRQVFALSIERKPAVVLSSGTQELWLSRVPNGGFALTPRRFMAPPDALGAMLQAAQTEWTSENDESAILDLVASRIGGRWIALRRQRWDGELSNASAEDSAMQPRDFLSSRMRSAPKNRAVIAHFMMQRGQRGWFGLGASYDFARRLPAAADSAASLWRERIAGTDYLAAASHRDFALTLSAVGLWNEAADEFQKAELLEPGIVGAPRLKEAETNRARDPQNVVARQIEAEQSVGLGADHPEYLISALKREQQNTPSVLVALRIALEYSRLADETRAAAWGRAASDLMNRGAVRGTDAAWVQLLADHLSERQKLARVKPSNILHSALFTVRVWPGDTGAIPLLAALEEAQHTVYADFGIPMGNTEVILWRQQNEFARYTTQFSAQGGSEFVAALTLTKLVSTRGGPLVLGEEINTFSDARDSGALFSTIAHEYGHVAVRQLSRGRMVPVWFNEGIAASVEGGYDGYLNRVRRAANAGTLLPMREMQVWNVDGERAFLAYSQANSIVDYIVQNWGKNAVLEILRQIGRDTSPEDAFRGVLGVSQSELWEKWVEAGIR
ncbi:MAG TPA: hypothetical protein VGB45_03165 [Abditibacterium sp.]|jgi:hypothetical protein